MGRHGYFIQDDDYAISDLVERLRYDLNYTDVKDVFRFALISCALLHKKKLRLETLKVADNLSTEFYRKYERKLAIAQYKGRNFLKRMVEAIGLQMDNKALDNKKNLYLKDLLFNIHNPEMHNKLKQMNHKKYAEIREYIAVRRQRKMDNREIHESMLNLLMKSEKKEIDNKDSLEFNQNKTEIIDVDARPVHERHMIKKSKVISITRKGVEK